MTNLSEVYEGGVRTVVSPRQRLVGMSLFAVGAVLVVGAIPIATTDLLSVLGIELGVFEAREIAGILAGLGVPAVFVGIFVVLPASGPTRGAAAIGASLAIFGVVLFQHAYPDQWLAANPQLALATAAVYSLGAIITSWCLFIAAATFKTRNDPGGTARIEITDGGKVRVVRSPEAGTKSGGSTGRTFPGFGSVGLFGSDPDGSVPTQTNDDTQTDTPGTDDAMVVPESSHPETSNAGQSRSGTSAGQSRSETSGRSGSARANQSSYSATTSHPATANTDESIIAPEPSSDGGTASVADPAVEDDILQSAKQRSRPDQYCGNCAHFEYVRVEDEMVPYCGQHKKLLEDMEACDEWDANS